MIDIAKGRYWDVSWNPIVGCSAGCLYCWARDMSHRFKKCPMCAEFKPHVHPERFDGKQSPLHWRKPRVVFVALMGDLADSAIEGADILMTLHMAKKAPQHTCLFCTRHLDRMARALKLGSPNSNWWIGTTVTNQDDADLLLPGLMKLAETGWKTWVSIEPMLGPVELFDYLQPDSGRGLSQVVLGGMNGPGSPMDPDWARRVRDDCPAAGVPFFLKSVGQGKGRILDGRTHDDLAWNL